jgi:Mg2+ and Co2+ transporter CorA
MLTLFVFDERESRRTEDLPDALEGLDEDAMLWVALRDPTKEEVAVVQEALELSDKQAHRLLEQPGQAGQRDLIGKIHPMVVPYRI